MANFSQEQIAQMREWVKQVHSVSEFQSKLNAAFDSHLTYLETRFLMDDLDLQLASEPEVQDATQDSTSDPATSPSETIDGSVQVSVDPVTRPGMVFNGSVTFPDGQRGSWGLDQLGRISLKPEQHGYRPSQEDVAAFQRSLQQQLSELSKRNSFGL